MTLTIYEKDILNNLIDIYERRLYNNSDFKQAVAIRINSKDYKEYFKNQNEYDKAIGNLRRLNYITTKNLKNERVVERVILNITNVATIYEKLNRDNLNVKIEEFEKVFFSYKNETISLLQNDYLKAKEEKRSIKSYLTNNYIDAIKGIYYLELNTDEIFERNFSVQVYNDSKRLEQLKPLIVSFYNNDKNIFEKYNVVRKPTYLYLKGKGTIIVNNENIDLDKLNIPIGITVDNELNIRFKNVLKVITIENETTFYEFNDDKALIIYLAGFSNSHKIHILNKLKIITEYIYHYGDIDYGGFNILAHLRANVSPNIKPLNMDLKTLKELSNYHIAIQDKKYLDSLKILLKNNLLEDCHEVISYMIEKKVKTEQESLV